MTMWTCLNPLCSCYVIGWLDICVNVQLNRYAQWGAVAFIERHEDDNSPNMKYKHKQNIFFNYLSI